MKTGNRQDPHGVSSLVIFEKQKDHWPGTATSEANERGHRQRGKVDVMEKKTEAGKCQMIHQRKGK